LAKTSAD